MSQPQDNKSWIAEGATVAELVGRSGEATVQFTTIIKLTKTQIVTASDRRYNREGLYELGKRYGGRKLRQVTDGDVRDAVARQELSSLRGYIDRLCKSSPTGADAILDIIDLIEHEAGKSRTAIQATADAIVENESNRVVVEALAAAYQDTHAALDNQQPTTENLSRTSDKLAVALRAMGSSAGQALSPTEQE